MDFYGDFSTFVALYPSREKIACSKEEKTEGSNQTEKITKTVNLTCAGYLIVGRKMMGDYS